MKTKAVIFDLDGTLLNTLQDIGDCLNFILAKHGLSLRTYDEYKNFLCNGSKKLVERAVSGNSNADIDTVLAEYKAYYSENYSVKTAPYEGITDLLKSLISSGVKLGVYSNKPDNIVKELVEKHFPSVFDSVRGQMDSVPVKPSPEGAWLTADEIGVKYEDCIFVGDSAEDRETAINAGMVPVNVSWGYRSGDFLKAHGAEICVDTAAELLAVIENI